MLQESEDPLLSQFLMNALQNSRASFVTNAFIKQLNTPMQILNDRNSNINAIPNTNMVNHFNVDGFAYLNNNYLAINKLTHQHHLQNLANSTELLKTLADLSRQEGEDRFARYGAFVLLSSVTTSEAFSLLDTHQSDFLKLIEANFTADLPFYLPEPLSSDQTEPPNPFDELTLIAFNPYSSSDSLFVEPTIRYIPQGAKPGETREAVTARLAGKPAVCRFPWVAKNWSRCQD